MSGWVRENFLTFHNPMAQVQIKSNASSYAAIKMSKLKANVSNAILPILQGLERNAWSIHLEEKVDDDRKFFNTRVDTFLDEFQF